MMLISRRTMKRFTRPNPVKYQSMISTDSNSDIPSVDENPNYQEQRQTYQRTKEKLTSDLAWILTDSSVVIVSDWLKVRGTFRDWTRLWAVLRPGLLLLYRSPTSMNGVWVGTVILSSCQVIQRPSKRSGFCFKIWNSLDKSIWTQKGPNNEQIGAFTFPLPITYLICRASDETTGRCWIDALELAMKCSTSFPVPNEDSSQSFVSQASTVNSEDVVLTPIGSEEDRLSDVSVDISKISETSQEPLDTTMDEEENQTPYVIAPTEEMAELGNAEQTDEVVGENKSLIRHLLKQVRPGMDLSKVVLPTFILEPRSFLEKISDYYYHCDILEEAVNSSDPLIRMKTIVKFYLSGFYKKPKGLKKPYNPVLGEVYRCFFHHPKSDSKTFYIAEQISHHPPITNFYVSNRQEGFGIQGTILTKSKFYGNSISAILDGTARLTLLARGEDYLMTMPYANCKGILIGKLTMELGGKVTIVCEKTRYSADIEFKLKPFIGGQEYTNYIEGNIRLEDDIMYTFSGRWDDEIILVDQGTNERTILWKVTPTIVQSRLKRYVVPIEQQQDNESERLWQRVSMAIETDDQNLATQEKSLIENEQRRLVKERKATSNEWHPHLFCLDSMTKEWVYTHTDDRPWDSHNDISTYEKNFIICTRTRHWTHPSISHGHPPTLLPAQEKSSSTDEDLTLIFRRIENNLLNINQRFVTYNEELHHFRGNPDVFLSPNFQLLLFLLVIGVLFKNLLS